MDDQNKKIMFWVIGAVAVTALLAWMVLGNNKNEDASDHHGPGRISGELTFDALTPEEDDEGSIEFVVRKHNTGDVFTPATMSITPSFDNGGTWMIEDLDEGVLYDVQATLVIEGEEVTKSQIATVTAPASDVDMILTVTWTELPKQSIQASQNKEIAGTLAISGYIPDSAFYGIWTAPARDESDLSADEVDDPKFTRVLNNQPANTTNSWKWDGALAQVDYRVRAELYTASGDYIGTSNILDAVVPQNNIALGLQSGASTEPVTETLSGLVKLQGSYKSDSTISVQIREDGSGGFTEVDSFPAESSKKWVYSDAKAGVEYDVRAVLQRKGNDIATSKQEHTTAPDNDVDLTIDTSMNLVDPSTKPSVTKCDKRDDGDYDVTLNFPGINNAESYWIRVGKDNGAADRFNEPETPDNTGDAVNIKLHIDSDKYYYTDYAYSYCKDCTTLDSYSDFSDDLKFYCGDDPEDD
ncbi:MAG: hypothetical protein U9Q12_02140 [Patescibacteria group bacterium]|nr:hypothetical protein [Patescibacteria group bacterium]